ncbi:MAG: hypothetical protein JWO78_196 [Micavibrio sp.]|nr:hypothetical protein [Micavibrio sp.]
MFKTTWVLTPAEYFHPAAISLAGFFMETILTRYDSKVAAVNCNTKRGGTVVKVIDVIANKQFWALRSEDHTAIYI